MRLTRGAGILSYTAYIGSSQQLHDPHDPAPPPTSTALSFRSTRFGINFLKTLPSNPPPKDRQDCHGDIQTPFRARDVPALPPFPSPVFRLQPALRCVHKQKYPMRPSTCESRLRTVQTGYQRPRRQLQDVREMLLVE